MNDALPALQVDIKSCPEMKYPTCWLKGAVPWTDLSFLRRLEVVRLRSELFLPARYVVANSGE